MDSSRALSTCIRTVGVPPEKRVEHWEHELRNHLVGLRCSSHADEGLLAQQKCLDFGLLRIGPRDLRQCLRHGPDGLRCWQTQHLLQFRARIDALIDAALRLAQASSYCGLGTFEVLVDDHSPDLPLVFIEANPRLQVEHTVTEQVTGLDLVQLHCPPTEVYYRPEVFGVMDDLVRAGKIRYFGFSDMPAWYAAKAATLAHAVASFQLQQGAAEEAMLLVDNALKYGGAARGRVYAEDGMAIIEIDDDGPGLPKERRAEATRRGRRLDETKPGSGLGLSIVVDQATLHGGELSLERSPLGGLRARLTLPSV